MAGPSLFNRIGRALTAAGSELRPTTPPQRPAPDARIVRGRVATNPRAIRSVFKGASVNLRTGDWMPSTMAPDDEVRSAARILRARARQLSRDNALIGQFLALLTSNVLGAGGRPFLQADVRGPGGEPDEAVNKAIESAWDDWRERPVSADGKWDLATFEQLQLQTAFTDGECFTRMLLGLEFRHGLGLQAIDCDLVDELLTRSAGYRDSEIRMGIEVDRLGRPLRYWVRDDPQYMPGQEARRHYAVDAADVLHGYRAGRANQTRGVTMFARVMYDLNMLAGYNEGALTLLRTAANKMGFIEWKDTSLTGGGGAEDLSETVATSDAADGSGAPGDSSLTAPGGPYFEADPGSIHELAAGQTFSSWDPSHPSSSQGDFVKLIIRMVASGLGVTYHSIASDLADVNFSTAREGRIIERELWRILQGWWIQTFRQPMYERWLQASTLSGTLVLPSADWRLYTRARWIPRGFDWVDPESEANASATQLSLGLTSRKRILAERGLELDTVMRELAEEQAIAEELGLDIDGPKGSEPAGAAAAGKGKDEPGADGKKNGNGNGRTRRSITNRLTSATR